MGKDLKNLAALRFQIHHLETCSEPDVVGEMPAYVIGIIVDDELHIPRYARMTIQKGGAGAR
jgi:hypothetical protein